MNKRRHTHSHIHLYCCSVLAHTKGHTLRLLHLVRRTSAVDLIGCYFTVGGGALRVYISEDETSQIDVCLAHVNLKLHCSLQGQGPKASVGERCKCKTGGRGSVEGRYKIYIFSFKSLNPALICGPKGERRRRFLRESGGSHQQPFNTIDIYTHPSII